MLIALSSFDPLIIQPDEFYAAGEEKHVIAYAWDASGAPILGLSYDPVKQDLTVAAKPDLDGKLADVPADLIGVTITSSTIKAVHLVGSA